MDRRPKNPLPPRTLNAQVEKVIFGGKGMVREDGKIGFVPYTIDGETIEVEVGKAKKDYFEGKLTRLVLASPHRVEPPCPYFGRCGGCAYQHISYPHQLELKREQVANALARIGGFEDVEVAPVVPSPQEYGYRNRITVHRRNDRIGFVAAGNAHYVVDIRECLLAQEPVNDALARLRRAPYEEGDITLRAPDTPASFSQVNAGAVPLLLRTIEAALEPSHATLIDAYCGTGLYSLAFAGRYGRVVGLEWSRTGIRLAERYLAAAGHDHVEFIQGDVAAELPGALGTAGAMNQVTVILNPPSVGVEAPVVETLLAAQPAGLVYISCNPATLARDLKRLGGAYELVGATPVDLFPQTAEVEVVARLRLR